MHGSSPDESFNIPFIQKAHSIAIHSALNPVPTGSSSVDSRVLSFGECPLGARLPDSGATSEEECTNSYLTLCNEYEQEKLEPEEDPCTQKHACSALNTDSLCSPVSMQELCFFTEEDQLAGFMDQCTSDHLNPSPPKELFYSKGEDVCKPLFFPSDADIEATEEPLEKLQEESDLWRSDGDQCSNELPVISFKEAVSEDANVSCAVEGQPPDLLVNLPALEGGTGDVLEEVLVPEGNAFPVVDKTSPTFGRPDVLQRGENAEFDPSVDVATLPLPQKPSKTADLLTPSSPKLSVMLGAAVPRTQKSLVEHEDVGLGSEGTSGELEVEKVSKLFQELDRLAAVSLDTRIPEAMVRSWAVDMVVALDALHQEGVICRDLNPSNILLNDTGESLTHCILLKCASLHYSRPNVFLLYVGF